MNKRGIIFLVVVLVIFIGVSIVGFLIQRSIEEQFYKRIPDQVSEIGEYALNYYLERDYESVKKLFVDEINDIENPLDFMVEISDHICEIGELEDTEVVGYHINITNGIEVHSVVLELKFSEKYMLYTFIATEVGNEYRLYRTDFNELEDSLNVVSRFDFDNTGFMHYVVLFLCIVVFAFSVYTSAVSFSSNKKRKVLWSIFALSGIASFTFVWNSGEWNINLFSIYIPAATINRAGTFASFVFCIRFPLGAILYWLLKHNKNEEVEVKSEELEAIENVVIND